MKKEGMDEKTYIINSSNCIDFIICIDKNGSFDSIFFTNGVGINYMPNFFVEFLFGLFCFISGILILLRKKYGYILYRVLIIIMILVYYFVAKTTDLLDSSKSLEPILIPAILCFILMAVVKKTKYFEPE